MKNFLKILKKVIEKTDYFYFTLITISLITALLIEDGSWRLILFSISILFIVALISSLAQKFTEYYENVPRSMFNSEVDYEVTTKSSELGTKQSKILTVMMTTLNPKTQKNQNRIRKKQSYPQFSNFQVLTSMKSIPVLELSERNLVQLWMTRVLLTDRLS